MKLNNKGFTVPERLIIVEIAVILIALSVPFFTTQIEKSRESTDLSNLKNAYSLGTYKLMTEDDPEENQSNVHSSSVSTVRKYIYSSSKQSELLYMNDPDESKAVKEAADNGCGRGTSTVGMTTGSWDQSKNNGIDYDPSENASMDYIVVDIDWQNNTCEAHFAGYDDYSDAFSTAKNYSDK